MLSPNYTSNELKELKKFMPEGVTLNFNMPEDRYVMTILPEGERVSKIICRVPRGYARQFRNPHRVMNYMARRALYINDYPVDMRRSVPD